MKNDNHVIEKIKIEKIILNLRIMSKIPINTKIHIDQDDEIIIETQNTKYTKYINAFKRSIFQYNRKQVLLKIKNMIIIAIDYVEKNNSQTDILNLVNTELRNCILGLDNLISTYITDQNTVSFIELLKEQINRHTLKYPDFYNHENIVRELNDIDFINE